MKKKKTSPFKFLDAYELKDKDHFFGRSEEIDALYGMVFKTSLLLIYGLSGTGKTSLIQCGLAGRFAGPNWLPFFIRRGKNINESLSQALGKAFPEEESPKESLLENARFLFRYYLRPVYLILDQFEELFILGDREEQLAFARSIRELVDAELPCKIILVMREEFIGQLYYLEKEIPNIYDFRLRVEPMGYKKVQEVVSGSFEKFLIGLEDPVQNTGRIYEKISAGKSGVQLPYLQVYMDMLWKECYEKAYGSTVIDEDAAWLPLQISGAEIDAFGDIEDVLARFLHQQEAELQQALETKFPGIGENAVRQIFDVFVTERGTKRPVRFSRRGEDLHLEAPEDKPLPDLSQAAWNLALKHLETARLLRDRDDALELAHDSLAALIDQERSDEERKLNEIRNRLKNALDEYQRSEGHEYVPNKKLLQDTEAHLADLALSAELLAFYQNGWEETKRLEAAREEGEKQRALAEEKANRAEEEARLRQIAEKARRRATSGAVVATLLAVLAGVLGVFAFSQRQEALVEKEIAVEQTLLAEENEEEANLQATRAEAYADTAGYKTREAEEQRRLAQRNELIAKQALSRLEIEQQEKERLQISAKADIVESFLSAGHCDLAQTALQDLQKITRKYLEDPDIQHTASTLKTKVENCK